MPVPPPAMSSSHEATHDPKPQTLDSTPSGTLIIVKEKRNARTRRCLHSRLRCLRLRYSGAELGELRLQDLGVERSGGLSGLSGSGDSVSDLWVAQFSAPSKLRQAPTAEDTRQVNMHPT